MSPPLLSAEMYRVYLCIASYFRTVGKWCAWHLVASNLFVVPEHQPQGCAPEKICPTLYRARVTRSFILNIKRIFNKARPSDIAVANNVVSTQLFCTFNEHVATGLVLLNVQNYMVITSYPLRAERVLLNYYVVALWSFMCLKYCLSRLTFYTKSIL